MPRDRRSAIIFKNETEALDFHNKHFKKSYTLTSTNHKLEYKNYQCRRKQLKIGFGHYPCQSSYSISPTFNVDKTNPVTKAELKQLGPENLPYSVIGLFYHSHSNDERYHRDELGVFRVISDKPRKTPYKPERPRFRNGKIFPLSARLAGITKEDIEKARLKQPRKTGSSKSVKTKTKKAVYASLSYENINHK